MEPVAISKATNAPPPAKEWGRPDPAKATRHASSAAASAAKPAETWYERRFLGDGVVGGGRAQRW